MNYKSVQNIRDNSLGFSIRCGMSHVRFLQMRAVLSHDFGKRPLGGRGVVNKRLDLS